MKAIILSILAVCCLPFFGVGLYDVYQNYAEIRTFVGTEGTVVGNRYATVMEDGIATSFYQPEVEFDLPDGRKMRFTDKVGSLPPDYEVGNKLRVLYDPANPNNARIHSLKRFWLAPTIFMIVGILPILIAYLILRRLNF